jgi:hypothetical protein
MVGSFGTLREQFGSVRESFGNEVKWFGRSELTWLEYPEMMLQREQR